MVVAVGDGCRDGPQSVQGNEEMTVDNEATKAPRQCSLRHAESFWLVNPRRPFIEEGDGKVLQDITNVDHA